MRRYSANEMGTAALGDAGDDRTRSVIAAWLNQQELDLILDASHAMRAVKEVLFSRYTAGHGERFRADWNIFFRGRLDELLAAIGLEREGELDMQADWPRIRKEMRDFHGHPYSSVGIAFRKGAG